MIRCFTTSEGYDVIQKICAERPPAQKLIAGVEREVCVEKKSVRMAYEPHQKKKKERKRSVADNPWYRPRVPWAR